MQTAKCCSTSHRPFQCCRSPFQAAAAAAGHRTKVCLRQRSHIPSTKHRHAIKPALGLQSQGLRRTRQSQASRGTMTVTAAAEKPSIGWCGVGTLGLPMVSNLVNAGYPVTVWNRNPARCDPLVEAGAKLGSSPREVAEQCQITFAVVSDPAAALEVATGPDGVAAGMSEGKGYIDVSTVDAGTAQQVAEAVRGAGARYLEAPVSGSKQPAEKGQLIFLAGGDRELYDEAMPMLEVMGKRSFFLGEVGQGAKMKLVINMIMGTMMASFAEGLALAKRAGLSQEDLLEASGLGAIAAPMFAMKGPSMLKGEYPTAFPLKHQQKDLRLVLELADSKSQPLPVAAAANSLFEQAVEGGFGDSDFSAVLATLTSD